MKGSKKIVGIGVCMLVLLSTFSVAGIGYKKGIAQLIEETSVDSSQNVTIIYEFHQNDRTNLANNNRLSGKTEDQVSNNVVKIEKTLDLTKDELEDIVSKIKSLWQTFENSSSPTEKMNIFKQILEIERNAGFLPSSFTIENINKTGEVLSRLFREHLGNKQFPINSDKDGSYDSLVDWGEPFLGFGSAACIVAPYAQVLPISLGTFGIEVENWEIPLFGKSYLDFVVTIGAAWFEILISHAAAGFGWAISFLPPNSKLWIGPFYSIWGLNAGISLTIYLKSDPSAVCLLDLCIWGGATNVILPFSISDQSLF